MVFRVSAGFDGTQFTTIPQTRCLRVDPMQRARERNRLAHVLQAADPAHHPLDAHAEARVGHAAVAPQVEIPLEGLARQVVLVDALAPAARSSMRCEPPMISP